MSVTTSIYNALKNDIFTKAVSLSADTLKCALFSASTFGATNVAYTTEGTEVTQANGYLTGGQTLTSVSVTGTTTVKWLGTCPAWTASGAGFSAVAAKIYSVTNSNRPICHIDFGGTQTASGGGAFTITLDASNGILSVA